MHRRRFLSLVGLTAFAGCTDAGLDGDPSVSNTTDATNSGSTTATAATAYPPGESTFEGECPSLDGDAVCYHRSGEGADSYLHPSSETVDATGDRVTFTLVNRSDERFTIGPYYWELWGRSDGDWARLDDRETVRDLGAEIPPGSTFQWQLVVGDASASDDPSHVVYQNPTPGRCAFVIETAGERYAALFSAE